MRLALLLVICASVIACSTNPTSGPIAIELGEFYIAPESDSVLAGQVTLEVSNDGQFPHTVVVATSAGEVVAASEVIAPDSSFKLALDLHPGTYQLTCRIVFKGDDGRLIDHYQEGMGALIHVES